MIIFYIFPSVFMLNFNIGFKMAVLFYNQIFGSGFISPQIMEGVNISASSVF